MKTLLLVLFVCLYLLPVFAQAQNFTTTQVDSLIRHIDRTCISGGITDYTIRKKGDKKKRAGQGADWYYTDSSGTILLKTFREISLESETMETFYFYKDSLIYWVRTNGTYTGDKKTINWTQQCYFIKEKIFLQQNNAGISFNPATILKTARSFFTGDQVWRKPFK